MSAAIVTGASSGIGFATAVQLAEAGFDLGVTYHRNRAGAEQLVRRVEQLGRRAVTERLDAAGPARAAAVVEALADRLGDVTVLVNNAAVNPRARTLEATVEQWSATLDTNLVTPWACAQAVARRMVARGLPGRIVNVTSVLAFVPLDGGGPYCAAKAGLELLTKVMALELAPSGISVNAVAPGHTATPMNYASDALEEALEHRPVIPLGRAAAADEVAAAIRFLVEGSSSYMTGASLLVDGGLLLVSGPQQLQHATDPAPGAAESPR